MADAWRLNAARALAWALLLGGWIVIAQFADRLAAGPLAAYGLVALWLFALGGFTALLGRLRLPAGVWRVLLLASALIAVRGLFAALQGGGLVALLPALLAWALLVALASVGVRSLRLAAAAPPGPPLAAAAAGALLAWGVVGDPADLGALVPRVAALLVGAALVLALLPRGMLQAARAGCRAGLFDCALPAWPAGALRSPARWPLWLASLVMLPMMCSLPQMLALCRSESVDAPVVLAVHLGAMFMPALLWRRAGSARSPALACAVLLAAGGAAAWWPGSVAWWWLAVVHGSAWSLAWAAQLAQPTLRAPAHSSPLRAAFAHALFALALGSAVAAFGLQALLVLQLALAAAGASSLAVALSRQHVAEHLEGLPRRSGR
jgi:hypothetical protein